MNFPVFDERLPDLYRFISMLSDEYHAGKINTWDNLEERVNTFFTPEQMDQVEAVAPGWKRMASYADGITRTHVVCVFLGLVMLPEYQSLSPEQQQLAKWIVLFHDVEKIHIRGQRDYTHGFRSAAVTADALAKIGFPITARYQELYPAWRELTNSALTVDANGEEIQDNTRLPEILSGIETMFRGDTPAVLIVKGVLFHMSINVVKDWPQAAPLSHEEIARYTSPPLAPLLKVMNLSDNEGWTMFEPGVRTVQRNDTLEAFREVERLIFG